MPVYQMTLAQFLAQSARAEKMMAEIVAEILEKNPTAKIHGDEIVIEVEEPKQ